MSKLDTLRLINFHSSNLLLGSLSYHISRPLVEDMDFVVRCKLSALYKRTEASRSRPTIHLAIIRLTRIPLRHYSYVDCNVLANSLTLLMVNPGPVVRQASRLRSVLPGL